MDLSAPLSTIQVEFGDGILECRGHISTSAAEFISHGDGETIEHAAKIYIEVVRDGYVDYGRDAVNIEPGRYLVDETGLYRRCEHGPSAES